MIYVHLTFSSVGRLALFTTEALRRVAVRTVVRVAGDRLVLFCVVDDHTHVVIVCEVGRENVIAGGLLRALRSISRAEVASPHVRLVERRAHLSWLVPYSIDQTAHHGIEGHPACWSGSCFQDLVGARAIGFTDARIRTALPRFSRRDFFRMAGLPLIVPADDSAIRRAGAARIVEASAAAVAADPALQGNGAEIVLARRIAAATGVRAGVSVADLAWTLEVTPRAARRLAAAPLPVHVLDAARMQLAISEAVARGAGPMRRAAASEQ